MKLRLYWNLRKKCYSVQHKRKVIAHVPSLCLRNAKFIVSEAGRQRVLRDKRKNVHAYVEGYWHPYIENQLPNEAYYNPYKTTHFIDKNTNSTIHTASLVHLSTGGKVFYLL